MLHVPRGPHKVSSGLDKLHRTEQAAACCALLPLSQMPGANPPSFSLRGEPPLALTAPLPSIVRSALPHPPSPIAEGVTSSSLCPGIFGQRLEDTVHHERKYGPRLAPLLVEQCVDFIRERGLTEEGLFRMPGQANLVRDLQDSFDCGEKPLFDR